MEIIYDISGKRDIFKVTKCYLTNHYQICRIKDFNIKDPHFKTDKNILDMEPKQDSP